MYCLTGVRLLSVLCNTINVGDVKNITDFDAEIEMCLGEGEEQEKYLITEPTVVRIPAGVYHGPLEYKRIGKPVTFISVFLAPEYKRIFPTQ